MNIKSQHLRSLESEKFLNWILAQKNQISCFQAEFRCRGRVVSYFFFIIIVLLVSLRVYINFVEGTNNLVRRFQATMFISTFLTQLPISVNNIIFSVNLFVKIPMSSLRCFCKCIFESCSHSAGYRLHRFNFVVLICIFMKTLQRFTRKFCGVSE